VSEEWIEKGNSTLLVGLAVGACPLATFITVLLFINPGQHGWLVAEILKTSCQRLKKSMSSSHGNNFTGLGDP
jgi:hypothetical protein